MTTAKVALVIRENGEGPAEDPESPLVAAAIACGYRFSSDKALLDFVERLPDGSVRRRTAWSILDEARVIDGERLTFREFQKRFEDLAWIEAHRESTIARLHVATTGLHHLHRTAFRRAPHVCLRHGARFAMIPPDATEHQVAEWVGMLQA